MIKVMIFKTTMIQVLIQNYNDQGPDIQNHNDVGPDIQGFAVTHKTHFFLG